MFGKRFTQIFLFPKSASSALAVLTPSDLCLFSTPKTTLNGKWFQDLLHIQPNMTQQLTAIPQVAYHRCIEKWRGHWNRCTQAGGSYFQWELRFSTVCHHRTICLLNSGVESSLEFAIVKTSYLSPLGSRKARHDKTCFAHGTRFGN